MQKKSKTMIFRVSLLDIKREIWRIIEVPATYSFWDLHVAIQDAMGWLDYHLHVFRVPDSETGEMKEIGIPDEEGLSDSPPVLPGWEIAITDHFINPGDQMTYEYDFGDSWEHRVILEGVADRKKGTKYPKCLDGKRACPPEDCGGVSGYEELSEIISNPKHEKYDRMMEWLGGNFDPERFYPDRVKFDNPKRRWVKAFSKE
jgi:hypothetical protein